MSVSSSRGRHALSYSWSGLSRCSAIMLCAACCGLFPMPEIGQWVRELGMTTEIGLYHHGLNEIHRANQRGYTEDVKKCSREEAILGAFAYSSANS